MSIRAPIDAREATGRDLYRRERSAGLDLIAAVAAVAAALGTTTPALPLKPYTRPGFIVARCGQLAVREDRRRPPSSA